MGRGGVDRFLCPSPKIQNPATVTRQPRNDFAQSGFSPGFNCFFRLVLNRMLHVYGIKVRPAKRARLRPRRQHELMRRHRDGRNS